MPRSYFWLLYLHILAACLYAGGAAFFSMLLPALRRRLKPEEFELGLHYGKQDIDAGGDYVDYGVGVTREWAGLEVGLTWYDTDISSCNICESRVVLSLTRSM